RQLHNFHDSGDDDYLNFTAIANSVYIIETHLITDADITDTTLTLYDTDGLTQLDYNDNITSGGLRNSKIIWTAASSGNYFIKASELYNSTGGQYEISIVKLGHLIIDWIEPTENLEVDKNSFFNVTMQLKCIQGTCLNTTLYLDPKKVESKAAKEVEEKIAKEKEIPVIIYLKTGTTISDNQNQILSDLKQKSFFFSPEFKLKYRYSELNALAGNITKSALKKLKKNPYVEKIDFDSEVKATLQSSVPKIRADEVWPVQLSNQNLTGLGETICILDTGINYSHADFGSCALTEDINDGSCAKVIGGYDFVNGNKNPYDDHGHGSHVAGIASSQDKIYRGVAPGANIVAIKVLDSNGEGSNSDVIAGIDWCISNKSRFNITVISMSLGKEGSKYNEPCNHITEAAHINSAVGAGIIVTVSSGNDNYTDGISSPACAGNATSVGAIDDNGNFYYNRGYLLDLVAPGRSITATDYDGSHATFDGTSSSAPHAAGLAAIVAQYGKLKLGRTLSPKEIEHVLKHNSKNLYDSDSKLIFPLIDAYEATNAKGIIPNDAGATPFYTLDPNPTNNSCISWLTDGRSCNVTWRVRATGNQNTTWKFFAVAENEYMHNTSSKLDITIISESYVNLTTPNGTFFDTAAYLNCTIVSSETLSNISLYTSTSGVWTINQTLNVSGTINQTSFSVLNLNQGEFYWNCLAKDISNNNILGAMNYTIKIDNEAPLINHINKTDVVSLGSSQFIYTNVSDFFLDYVNISINNENLTLNGTAQFNYSIFDFENGTINFIIYALDKMKRLNHSSSSYYVNDTSLVPEIYSVFYNENVSYNNVQTINGIILDSYNLTKVYFTYNSINISMDRISAYNYTYTWNISSCGQKEFSIYAENSLGYSGNYASSFLILNCCGNDLCETGESCSSCSADCGSCPPASSSSGGGGGGGGSSGPLKSMGFIIKDAVPEKPIKLEVSSSAIPINRIEFNLKEKKSSFKVNVKILDAKPDSVEELKTKVYAYIGIYSKDLSSKNVDVMKISFTLPKEKLENINPNKIRLFVYDGVWKEQPTTLEKTSGNDYHYHSEASAFTYYAISETIKEQEESKIIPKNSTEEKKSTTAEAISTHAVVDTSPIKKSFKGIILGIVAILFFVLLIHHRIEKNLKS
ncbi:MAG: S8 family serine peptidase, partial [Nanoarchaeota archaeon]|nr:S8 family serine peptidase [Nanoarchaeota archaeon]